MIRDEKIINESKSIYQDLIEVNDIYYENKYYIYEMNIKLIANFGKEDEQIGKNV